MRIKILRIDDTYLRISFWYIIDAIKKKNSLFHKKKRDRLKEKKEAG